MQRVLAPNIPNPLLVITKTANAACSLLLTNVELPQELLQQQLPSVGPPKAAIGRYEFGANLISNTVGHMSAAAAVSSCPEGA